MSDQKNDDQQGFEPLYEDIPVDTPVDPGEIVEEIPSGQSQPVSQNDLGHERFSEEQAGGVSGDSAYYEPGPQPMYSQDVPPSNAGEFDHDLTDFSDLDDGIEADDDDDGIFAASAQKKKKKSSFGMMLVAVSAVAILGAGGYFYTTNPEMISQIKDNLTGAASNIASETLSGYQLSGEETVTGDTTQSSGDISDGVVIPPMADMPPQPQAVTGSGAEPVVPPVAPDTANADVASLSGEETGLASPPVENAPEVDFDSGPDVDDMVLPQDVLDQSSDQSGDFAMDTPADHPVVVIEDGASDKMPQSAGDVPVDVTPVVPPDVTINVTPDVAPDVVVNDAENGIENAAEKGAPVDLMAPPPVVGESDVVAVSPIDSGVNSGSDTDAVIEDAVVPPVGSPQTEEAAGIVAEENGAVTTLVIPEPVAAVNNPDKLVIVDDVSNSPDPAALKQVETDRKAEALEQQEQQIADTYFDAPPGEIMKKLPAPSMDAKRGSNESLIVVFPKAPMEKVARPKRAASVPDATVSIETTSLEPRIVAANRALKLGRLDSAREMYEDLYAINPRDPRILIGRAVLFQKSGDPARAISAYEEVLDVDPDNTDAIINLTGLVRKDYPAEALGKLLDLRQKYPENATIAAQLGVACAESGNFEDAYRYLSMATSLEPQNAQHYYNMAIVAERGHDIRRAISFYEKALEVDAIYGSGRSVNRDVIYDRLTRLRGHS